MENPMTNKLANALPLLLLGGFAAPAYSLPICDQGYASVTQSQCDAATQVWQPSFAPGSPSISTLAECPPVIGTQSVCADSHKPPSPTMLNCEDMGNGTMCEAWPQGNGVTYSWTASGSLRFPYPGNPANPFRSASCWKGGAGSITVTVSSPYAISSSVTSNYYCAP
jgi:hypothetical protein